MFKPIKDRIEEVNETVLVLKKKNEMEAEPENLPEDKFPRGESRGRQNREVKKLQRIID